MREKANQSPPNGEQRLILFLFEAQDVVRGLTVEGSWWAHSREQALFWLRSQGYHDVRLRPQTTGAGEVRVKGGALAIFFRQIAVMFAAGIPLPEALRLASFSEDRNLSGVGLLLSELLRSGFSLSSAMRTFPTVFDPTTVGLISAAETSGRLALVLARLADAQERRYRLKASLISALTYPAILLTATGVMALLFLLYVFPMNQQVLASLNVEQPFFQRFLASLMEQAQSPWLPVVLLGLGGAVAVLIRSRRIGFRLRAAGVTLLLCHPALAELALKARALRLLEVLGLLLEGGGTIDHALKIMIEAAVEPGEHGALVDVRQGIIEGMGFAESLQQTTLLPPLVTSLLEVGEEAGRLTEIARRGAAICEEDLRMAIDTASTLIEPLLLAFTGLLTGVAVIATALPMLSVLRNL